MSPLGEKHASRAPPLWAPARWNAGCHDSRSRHATSPSAQGTASRLPSGCQLSDGHSPAATSDCSSELLAVSVTETVSAMCPKPEPGSVLPHWCCVVFPAVSFSQRYQRLSFGHRREGKSQPSPRWPCNGATSRSAALSSQTSLSLHHRRYQMRGFSAQHL